MLQFVASVYNRIELLAKIGSRCLRRRSLAQVMARSSASALGKRIAASFLVVVVVGGGAVATSDAGVAVGRIAGSSSVSGNGAAIYSIPIDVPAGRNGLRPSVALVYNSRSGHGLAGMGWSLSGLSSISRCRRTIAVDGERAGVTFGPNDRFCLNGQVLILRSGVYGDPGATYRPELHNYEVVTSNGSAATNSPSWFEVKRSNGMIYRYGNDPNSQIVAPDTGGEVMSWALNEIEDTVGNIIQFEYYDSQTGSFEFAPTEIKWTAGNSNTPLYRIKFDYDDRSNESDVRRGYRYGSPWERTRRLTHIRYQYNSGTYGDVRVYSLVYSDDGQGAGSATGRGQLTSVTLCEFYSANQDCLPATVIDYAVPQSDGWDAETDGPTEPNNPDSTRFGDYDGDGYTDIFIDPPAAGKLAVMLNNNGVLSAPIDSNIDADWGPYFPLDYNGDGRTDLIFKDGSSWKVLQASGNGPTPAFVQRDTQISSSAHSGFTGPTILDINGDGLSDLAFPDGVSTVSYYINNGDLVQSNTAYPTTPATFTIGGNPACTGTVGTFHNFGQSAADVDGDGRDDLLVRRVSAGCSVGSDVISWAAYRSTGNGFGAEIGTLSGADSVFSPDINGDGLADLVATRYSETTLYSVLSKGDGVENAANTAIVLDEDKVYLVDYNGDGYTDILTESGTQWRVYISDGSAYSASNYVDVGGPAPAGVDLISPTDLTGDGQLDLVFKVGNQWKIRTHSANAQRDMVTEITDGLGNYFKPYYTNASDQTIHTANGAATPKEAVHASDGAHIVSYYEANDGIGGVYRVDYLYEGGLASLQGRGFLGFARVQAVDSRDSLRDIAEYRQDFPYIGRVKATRVMQPVADVDLAYSETTWASFDKDPPPEDLDKPVGEPGNFYFVHSTKILSRTLEVDGTVIRQVEDDFLADFPTVEFNYTHGQPTKTRRTTSSSAPGWSSDTWIEETTFSYDDAIADLTNGRNCRGYPTDVTFTNTTNTSATDTRVRDRTYNNDCQLVTEIVGSGLSGTLGTEKLKTLYHYPSSGGLLEYWTLNDADDSLPERRTNVGWDDDGYRQKSLTSLISGQDSVSVEQTWKYELGTVATGTDPRGQTTTFKYDGFGRSTGATVPGSANSTVYYADCAPCFPLNSRYYVETLSADDNSSTRVFFDRYGREVGTRTRLVDGDYSLTEMRYDARGLLHKEYLPYISGSTGGIVTRLYNDLLGRVTKITAPVHSGGTADTNVVYTPLVTTTTDAEQHVTIERQNPMGQVHQVEPPIVGATTYKYAPFGEVAEVTDPGTTTVVKSWAYDGLGNPDVYTDANSGVWDYDYSVFGELIKQTDDKSTANEIVLMYDQLGRLEQRTEPHLGLLGGTTTTWEYYSVETEKGFGLIKKITGPTDLSATGFVESYSYDDSFGRPSSVTTTIDLSVNETKYGYNNTTGQLTSITHPDQPAGTDKFIYIYSNGYVDRIQWDQNLSGPADIYDVVDADPLGRPSEIAWGSAVSPSHTTEYDFQSATTLLDGIRTSTALGTDDVQNYSYTWDNVGNLATRADSNQDLGSGPVTITETFGYDALNRLESVDLNIPGSTVRTLDLTYSNNGNILTKSDVTNTSSSPPGVFQYGQNGAGPHAVTSIGSSAPDDGVVSDYNHYLRFHYDENGNMDCRGATTSACSGGDRIHWYSFNKPQEVNQGSYLSSFVYGPDRSRIKHSRSAPSGSVDITYVGKHFEVEEQGANLTRYRANVYAYGEMVYWIQHTATTSVCGVETATDSYFVLKDHLGSVDQLVPDVASGGAGPYSYDAFGLRRDYSGWADDGDYSQLDLDEPIDRGYTEHEHLDNVRALHMNGRIQDPIIGRMMSVDPIVGEASLQSTNGYSYVGNNPLSLIDPSGLDGDDAMGRFGGSTPALKVRAPGGGWCTASSCQRSSLGRSVALNGLGRLFLISKANKLPLTSRDILESDPTQIYIQVFETEVVNGIENIITRLIAIDNPRAKLDQLQFQGESLFHGPIRVPGATKDSPGFAQIEVFLTGSQNRVSISVDPVGTLGQRLSEQEKELSLAMRGLPPGRDVTLRMVTNISLESGEIRGPFANRFSDRMVMGGSLATFNVVAPGQGLATFSFTNSTLSFDVNVTLLVYPLGDP